MATASISESLSAAFRHFQAGSLDDAERGCREILAAEPASAAAMHLLGLVALRSGRAAEAVDCIGAACARDPGNAEAFANLGLAYQAAADPVRAAASFEHAVRLNPQFAEALTNLGNLHLAQGRFEEAIASHRQAIAARPGYAEAWCNLGIALSARKLPHDFEEAESCFGRALALRPNFAEAHNNYGLLLQDREETPRALAEYTQALALKPDYAEAHNNRGYALESEGNLPEAAAEYQRALQLKPDYAEAWNNCGGWLQAAGRLSQAAACFDRAIALKPDFAVAHYNRALLSLLLGDCEAGFRAYEWRWGFLPRRKLSMPLWQGQPIAGKRILLHAEQGLGDAIQFLRYAPLVAAAGGEVVLEVQQPLLRLAQEIPELSRVLCLGDPPPQCDWQCPLMSLPLAFGTRIKTIPANTPYLTVPKAAQRKAEGLDRSTAGLRVGLAWAGSPRHKKDRARSIPFPQLASLLSLSGIQFYSLQLGTSPEELERIGIVDLAPQIADLADTAALIQQLDLVISVDTAVAHLAGALGVPAWVLLPFAPDWRWLLERTDSPWYPSIRLFRQPKPGDWVRVLEAVKTALAAWPAKSARPAHLPPDDAPA